jgi:hypothetical protein
MKRAYKFQYIRPEAKECEGDAKFNELNWKHEGDQCPYCILLDDERDLKSLKDMYEESWSHAEHRLSTFRIKLPAM